MAATPIYPSGFARISKTILPADTTAYVDVYDNSAASTPVRVEALTICSNDTSTVNIAFARYDGAAAFLIGTVRAVTLSGTDGATARVNALTTVGTLAPDGINVLVIPAGGKLQAKSLANVTADTSADRIGELLARIEELEERNRALEVMVDRMTSKDDWEILIDMQRDQLKVRKAFKKVIKQLDDAVKEATA
jgi:hypothetical protein